MSRLNKQLLQTWKAQLRSWAREGDLLQASKRSLGLKKPPKDLKVWIESVSTGEDFKLPRITLLSSDAMQGAIGAYAGSTKTIYLNRQWIKGAQTDDAVSVLNEELGHYLDDLYNKTDTPGDEGRVFAQFILNGNNENENAFDPKQDNKGWINVSGNWIQVEFLNWTGTSGKDNFPEPSQNNADHDKLIGLGGKDTINGGKGNDKITGGAGDDVLDGGDGDDTLDGGDHKDIIYGGNGDDKIWMRKWGSKAYGNAGNDSIVGADQADSIVGGTGNDTLNGSGGKDTILGNKGYDKINGGDENDEINGGKGNDTIDGKNHDDVLIGFSGDDSINGGNGDDEITGGQNNDSIKGGNGNDVIDGGDGNDTINGGNHNDEITGGNGDDSIIGSAGEDTVSYSGKRCEYNLTFSKPTQVLKNNKITITHKNNGSDGIDIIKTVEVIKFADNITIRSVNEALLSERNSPISIREDESKTLSLADFGNFTDILCDLNYIKITELQ